MATIPVENAEKIVGYNSFSAAVAGAEGHSGQARAQTDGKKLLGREFAGAVYYLQEWVLEFSGPLWLRVYVQGTGIQWAVEDAQPQVRPSSDPVTFDWGRGLINTPDPARFIEDRGGAQFRKLYVNETGFFVYLRQKLILCFHAVRRLDNGEVILFVTEDD